MDKNILFQILLKTVNSSNLFTPQIQTLLRMLPLELREELSYQTHTMVVYYGQEVSDIRKAEETAAMRAAPVGYKLNELNGINIACGDRTINQYLIGTDAHNSKWEIDGNEKQVYESRSQILCWAHDLPFKNGSIDYMVALHILEHVPDPVEVVIKWLDVIKPGGGLGVIVPDWRYTWDARNDNHIWGHRWNPAPKLIMKLYEENWSDIAELEYFCTYNWKLSFDFVLRKYGKFEPFDISDAEKIPVGKKLYEEGKFYHLDD